MPPEIAGKTERRSPIKTPPLRAAGQSIREELFELLFDKYLSYSLASLLLWIVAALDWMRWFFRLPLSWQSCVSMTTFALAFTALAVLKIRRAAGRVKNLRLGLEGELTVGQFLDEFCRERGYKVLHDLKGDGFNVDHVLIGTGGIFSIETKTISKPTRGMPMISYDGQSVLIEGFKPDRDPVSQAKACANHVVELLAESTGRPASKIVVRPVVLYPEWFIEGSSSGREVWVLNLKSLLKFLDNERHRLSDEDIALFYSRLKIHNQDK